MPDLATDAGRHHVGHYRPHSQRLAGKFDLERMAHEAAAAIGADEIANADGFLPLLARNCRREVLFVLLETDQLASEFRLMAKLGQALSKRGLGQELRNHQRDLIGLRRRRLGYLDHLRILIAAVGAILTLRRVDTAGRYDAIDNSEVLEYFLGARLNALAARAAKGIRHFLDQAEIYVPA